MKTIIGVFPRRDLADEVLNELLGVGYKKSEISVILKEDMILTSEKGSKGGISASKIADGVVSGGLLGGLAGILVGLSSYSIPGLGALLIGGPLAAALGLTGIAAITLSGAATGILAGGLAGGLTEFGLSINDARFYEDKIKGGGVVISVPVYDEIKDNKTQVRDIFLSNGAQNIRELDRKL